MSNTLPTSNWLHGLHDPGGEHLMAEAPGWIVHTVALREVGKFDFRPWSNQGFTNICRINWGYNPHGTIPLPIRYDDFTQKIVDFIANSPGCDHYILGNEPNHVIERPDGAVITPLDYATCFNKAYRAVKGDSRTRNASLGVAAVAPWNDQTGDWLAYWRAMLNATDGCDSLTLHAYTHGTDPALVSSLEQRNGWYWHFPIFTQTLDNVPAKFKSKAVDITETDQGDDAWFDGNTGWVRRAYNFVDGHNQKPGTQKVRSLSLYRWTTQNNDRWHINDKPGVQEDFKGAVAMRFKVPGGVVDESRTVFIPKIEKETPAVPTQPQISRMLTPSAAAHGMSVSTPPLERGVDFWYAGYVDKLNEAQSGGRRGIYGHVFDKDGNKLYGIRLRISWENGNKEAFATTEDKTRDTAPWNYSYNFPLSPSLREFAIEVAQDHPSEKVVGIGMGINNNPGAHTVSVVNFVLENYPGEGVPVPVPTPTPIPVPNPIPVPTPTPPKSQMIVLPASGVVTQRWGENPQDYARFGIPGHNGVDIANHEATPIVAIALGVVAFVGNDKDYGNYVRIHHPQLGFDSFYAHMAEIRVDFGRQVQTSEVIGLMGQTGNATGPHVHLEIRLSREADAYVPMTGGYGKGRIDPAIVYWLLNRYVL